MIEIKIFDCYVRKLQKLSSKTFPRKTYFTWFFKCVEYILCKIVGHLNVDSLINKIAAKEKFMGNNVDKHENISESPMKVNSSKQ